MTDPDALAFLERVVGTASVTGDEEAVARVLVEAMAATADEAFVDAAGNAVGRWGVGPLRVTFLGHMDTVPGNIPVRVEDGVLHGRGAVDAKGSLCCAVAAMARLPASLREALSFRIVGAVEEEGPSSKGARFAAAAYERPDVVIIGEPSGWDAYTLGYKGRLMLRLTVERNNAHSSRDEPTAAATAVAAWEGVRRFVEADNEKVDGDGIFDALQVGLQEISSQNDGLLQRCSALLGFRLPPRWQPDVLASALLSLPSLAGIGADVYGLETAYRGDARSPLARAFRVAIRRHGGQPRPKLKTGTSDMNVVAPSWPVAMLAYGPGDASLDHTPEERIVQAEFLRAVDVLTDVLGLLAEEAAVGPGRAQSPDKR